MIRRCAVLWSTTDTFWYLFQAKCVIATMSWISETMHEEPIANWWSVTWSSYMKIIMLFCYWWHNIELKLIDLIISAKRELYQVSNCFFSMLH